MELPPMSAPSIPEGFTPWNVPATPVGRVEVICRDGTRETDEASKFDWRLSEWKNPADIIAYRVVG